jgi:hypothetical protein
MTWKEILVGFAVGAVAFGGTAKLALHLSPHPIINPAESAGRKTDGPEEVAHARELTPYVHLERHLEPDGERL